MKIFFISICFLALCAGSTAAQQQSATNSDAQFWNETSLSIGLDSKENWTLTLTGALRFGENFSKFVDRRVTISLMRRVNHNLSVGGAYFYRYTTSRGRARFFENRYTGNVTLSFPFEGKKTVVSNRNLLEYRSINSRPDTTLYRNRTQIGRKIKFFKTEITPFASAEFFYDTRLDAWTRGRYAVGFSRKLSSNLTGEFFYLRQQETDRRIGNLNVLAAYFRFNF